MYLGTSTHPPAHFSLLVHSPLLSVQNSVVVSVYPFAGRLSKLRVRAGSRRGIEGNEAELCAE